MQTLVVQMRRLKDRSGLSLASLQTKTGYSSSSWERYLNGRALPPQKAVEELARVGGVDPARLLALLEVAQGAWKQEVATAPAVDTPEPRNTRRRLLIGVCTAVVFGVAGLLVAAPWDQDGGTVASHGTYAYKPGKTYPCTVRRKHGRLYAGYSTTQTAVLSKPGWDVVEAQCLLRHRGFDPGDVDGVYGPKTTHAVTLLQKETNLAPDGVVGMHTWQELRR